MWVPLTRWRSMAALPPPVCGLCGGFNFKHKLRFRCSPCPRLWGPGCLRGWCASVTRSGPTVPPHGCQCQRQRQCQCTCSSEHMPALTAVGAHMWRRWAAPGRRLCAPTVRSAPRPRCQWAVGWHQLPWVISPLTLPPVYGGPTSGLVIHWVTGSPPARAWPLLLPPPVASSWLHWQWV